MSYSEGFSVHKLGSLCSKIGSGSTPRGGSEVYLSNGNFALIRSQNIRNDGFDRNGLVYLTQDQADKLANVAVESNDILLNITGDSVARCCQVDNSLLPARVNQHVAIIRPNPAKLDPRFLRYILISPRMQQALLNLASAGATRNALTKGMLESLEIPFPHIEKQRDMADILGCLDDKIELNRQICKMLEDIASTLFKSWFIDFDPVKAKAAGREPEGLRPEIAVLFPERFTDSLLGQIPQGWNVGKMKDIALQIKTAIAPLNYSNEEFYHYSLPSYDKDKIPAHDLGSSIKSNKTIISQKCVLLSKLNPEIPRVWLPQQDGKLRSICSTEFLAYEPKEYFSREYLYCFFTEPSFRLQLQGMVTGTSKSHQRVQPTALLSIDCVVPSKAVLSEFKNVTKAVFEKIQEMKHQTGILTKIRNFLLPKLMDGRIKLKEAEMMISSIT